MPPKKKTKAAGRSADQMDVAVHQLEDIMANVLAWLRVEEIMGKRRVCKKWKEAVKKTIVPPTDFWVSSVGKYNAMRLMTRAMPNLQQLKLGNLGWKYGHEYADGEDPNEKRAASTAHYTTYDIEIISNFKKLRILELYCAGLNGSYPFLFDSFPMLQNLSIQNCDYLK